MTPEQHAKNLVMQMGVVKAGEYCFLKCLLDKFESDEDKRYWTTVWMNVVVPQPVSLRLIQ
jgi:hypothetical protein